MKLQPTRLLGHLCARNDAIRLLHRAVKDAEQDEGGGLNTIPGQKNIRLVCNTAGSYSEDMVHQTRIDIVAYMSP